MSRRQTIWGAIFGTLIAGGALLAQSEGASLAGIWERLNARPALRMSEEELNVSAQTISSSQSQVQSERTSALSMRHQELLEFTSKPQVLRPLEPNDSLLKTQLAETAVEERAVAGNDATGFIKPVRDDDGNSQPASLEEESEALSETDVAPEGIWRSRVPTSDEHALGNAQNSVDLRADLFLGALSKQTIIRARPEPGSRILGFARTGSLLRRAAAPAGNRGCAKGWYRVEPSGFVCVGTTATLDIEHPLIQLASMQPDRSLAMPYIYGRSRYPTPTLYTKIPTKKEQQIAEQDLRGHLRKNFGSLWGDLSQSAPPSLLSGGVRVPRPYGYPRLKRSFMSGRALGNSAFAFIDLFESEGRFFGLTTDLSVVAMDRIEPIEVSHFKGQTLDEQHTLPLVYLKTHQAQLFRPTKDGKGLLVDRLIPYRAAIPVTGEIVERLGMSFYATRDGGYIRVNERVALVEERKNMPHFSRGERSWIDISLASQTLVAYRGTTPVFTTLISSGKGGVSDAKTSSATVQGTYLIHTKHVSATMSGETAEDKYDLRDVPYVQYFHEGYAFHTSHWHDSFGRPYSHGCINLSPQDARYLFTWTEPPVPLGWHSALSLKGTLVHIHP